MLGTGRSAVAESGGAHFRGGGSVWDENRAVLPGCRFFSRVKIQLVTPLVHLGSVTWYLQRTEPRASSSEWKFLSLEQLVLGFLCPWSSAKVFP